MTIIIPAAIIAIIALWLLRPRKTTFAPRRTVILVTIIPLAAVAIASIICQLIQNSTGVIEVAEVSNILFIISLAMAGAAILALIAFIIARKTEISKGLGFGLAVMVLLLIVELAVLEALAGV